MLWISITGRNKSTLFHFTCTFSCLYVCILLVSLLFFIWNFKSTKTEVVYIKQFIPNRCVVVVFVSFPIAGHISDIQSLKEDRLHLAHVLRGFSTYAAGSKGKPYGREGWESKVFFPWQPRSRVGRQRQVERTGYGDSNQGAKSTAHSDTEKCASRALQVMLPAASHPN